MPKRNLSGQQWDIGRRIRERREYLQAQRHSGFTQADAADHMGLTRSGYSFYENGRTEMRASDLYKLAIWLETSYEYLLGLSNGQEDWERAALHHLQRLPKAVRETQIEALKRLADSLP